MPIINLQKRARELGRIRIGQVQPTSNGRTRPAKLDRFRFTSASKPLLDKVAALYGGTVEAWTPQNGGASQWEVITDSTRLPILVPPQPVTQWYELWSGGGCKRRCDGQTEILSDTTCPCAQADEMLCKPTTRLNVVMRDVEGIGVFRLESHGYYAAVELPDVAAFLAQTGGYVPAFLALEERVVKREKPGGGVETRRFQVPTIEIEGVTPGELMAAPGQQRAAIERNGQAAIEAPPATDYAALIKAAMTREDVVQVWEQAKQDPKANGKQVEAAARTRVAALQQAASPPSPPTPPVPESTTNEAQSSPAATDAEMLWQAIVARWPRGMTELAKTFQGAMGVQHQAASESELEAFLKILSDGKYDDKPPAATSAADDKVPF